MNHLIETFRPEENEMRAVYCSALIREAALDDRIVAVDADVQYSMGTKPFYDRFPDRGFNCGIMEAHAVGMCAGMAATGLIPFFHAFGAFASRRAFDQVFLSCAYQKLNIKIIGGDPGITASSNGGTHMALEDMALMRTIPGITVIEPADCMMIQTAVEHMAQTDGMFYMRSSRRKIMRIYRYDAVFTIGKANILKEGRDVCIIACGIMVHEALCAQEILAKAGIHAAVIDMHTIKPLDEKAVIEAAETCGAIVTAENHNVTGGLGSAVSEILSTAFPVPLERVGVFESFGEVGTLEYLQKKFHLTAQDIAAKAVKCMERKKHPVSNEGN